MRGSNGELVWGVSGSIVPLEVVVETKTDIGGSGGAFTVTGRSWGASSEVVWGGKPTESKEKETNFGVAEIANLSRVMLFSRVRN